ncbi:MAG: Fe-S cluster assembly sulfur transfer protein SufU [Acidimicrobiales bacterium]
MGLEDLYREIILDHYRNPRNRGELPSPPAVRTEGFNPLCGDEIVLYLQLDGDVVSDVAIGGQGCSISQSSASMMSSAIKGKTVDEVRALTTAFKGLMSIHEESLGDGDSAGEVEASPADPGDGPALGDLEALRGVVKFPVRIKCATLSWNTLAQALDEAAT